MSATLMSLEVDNPPSLIKIVLNFEWEGESSLLAFRIRAHMSHSISGLHSPFFFFFFLMCTILKLFIGFVTMLLCFFCCLCSDLGAMRHVRCLSSPTRDRTLTLCLGKQSLNHRTASRVPGTVWSYWTAACVMFHHLHFTSEKWDYGKMSIFATKLIKVCQTLDKYIP